VRPEGTRGESRLEPDHLVWETACGVRAPMCVGDLMGLPRRVRSMPMARAGRGCKVKFLGFVAVVMLLLGLEGIGTSALLDC
jgi:hypothetical protein